MGITAVSPIHLELQMPGTIRWLQRLQPDAVLFCPMMIRGPQVETATVTLGSMEFLLLLQPCCMCLLRNPEAVYAAQYLKIPAVGLWTFAGPGGMVGVMDMFLQQSGIPLEAIIGQVDSCQPMKDSICRLQETYGITFDFRKGLSPMGFLSTMCETAFNLITTAQDFQDPCPEELSAAYAEAGANFEYVGPLLSAEGEASGDSGQALNAVAAAKRAGRKVVLASMGTILTSDTDNLGWKYVPRDGSDGSPRGLTGKQLCQAAWGAVFDAFGAGVGAGSEKPLLVVAIGPQPDALTDMHVPENALCLPVVPQVLMLKAGVDVFLTHGGQNSFMESLSAGVPVVVCPGFGDQVVNAMKAEALGVGLQVQRPVPSRGEEATAVDAYRAQVSASLLRVLDEPRFSEKARHCRDSLHDAGGVRRACELVVRLAAQAYPRLLGQRVAELPVGPDSSERKPAVAAIPTAP